VIFPDIDPIVHIGPWALQWGPLALRWYALAYVAGILLGWQYADRLVRDAKLWGGHKPTATSVQIDDLVLWITLGIILGGRIGYVLFYMLLNADQRAGLADNPLDRLQDLGGRHVLPRRLPGGVRGDRAVRPPAEDRHAEAGRPGRAGRADRPVLRPLRQLHQRRAVGPGHRPSVRHGVLQPHDPGGQRRLCPAGPDPRHPSQLYEAALEGVLLFLILNFAAHKLKWLQRRGALVATFLICYGLFRLSLENVRNPDHGMPDFPLGLTMGMILSIPMLLVGVWLLWRALREPVPAPLAEDHEPA
jgi:phosphatidylglycerol:prolipoprotein diacylglycerol transferase